VLVYRFHAGAPWSGDVAAVARLQRRQHAVAADGFRAVPRDPAGILAQADALLEAAPAGDADRLRARRPPALRLEPGPTALLHTDAGPANLVDGPDGLRLIDWQCPALGDPAEDLFSFASPAFQLLSSRPPLDAAARARHLEAYGDEATAVRLKALWPALTYRMASYCVTRRHELRTSDPAASERYAAALAASLEEL
jgi:aminoglycoside phosphotransferase (APT) family kinase protein